STPDVNSIAPTADFVVPDTVFTKQIVRFESTTINPLITYSWDFDPPFLQAGLDGGDMYSDRYSWSSAGTYPVELSMSNCGGTDVITKQITVLDPVSTPNIGFTADRYKAPVLSTITLIDTSKQGPYDWK